MARPRNADSEASEGREYQEDAPSVEEAIEKNKDLEAGAVIAPAGVQSTTEVKPSEADESPAPGPYRGDGAPKPDEPPVRAAKPDTPIAQTLAAGAGEHTPPDPEEFAPSGRPREVEEA
jgi:hypothetical protein